MRLIDLYLLLLLFLFLPLKSALAAAARFRVHEETLFFAFGPLQQLQTGLPPVALSLPPSGRLIVLFHQLVKLDHVVCHGDQVLPVHLPGSGGDSITTKGDVVTRRHDSFQYWWAECQLNDQKR